MKKEDIYITVDGRKMSRANYFLYIENPKLTARGILNLERETFTPNWKRIDLKSQKEGIRHVIDFIKKEAKHLSDRGYGQTNLLDGNFNIIADLRGSPKLKRKKEFIQV